MVTVGLWLCDHGCIPNRTKSGTNLSASLNFGSTSANPVRKPKTSGQLSMQDPISSSCEATSTVLSSTLANARNDVVSTAPGGDCQGMEGWSHLCDTRVNRCALVGKHAAEERSSEAPELSMPKAFMQLSLFCSTFLRLIDDGMRPCGGRRAMSLTSPSSTSSSPSSRALDCRASEAGARAQRRVQVEACPSFRPTSQRRCENGTCA